MTTPRAPEPKPQPDPDFDFDFDADPAPGRFAAVLGLATLAMLVVARAHWLETPAPLPRVPFVAGYDGGGPIGDRAAFLLLTASAALVAIARGARWACSLGAAATLAAVLPDQHRLQPWLQQFGVACLVGALVPPARALPLHRLYLVALYAHSALSKLDVPFTLEIGPLFLDALARPLGLDPAPWPEPIRRALIWALPAAEGLVALGLAWTPARRAAARAAIAMHLLLILMLGPWNLDQSANVLIWNAALALQAAILFLFPSPRSTPTPTPNPNPEPRATSPIPIPPPEPPFAPLARLVMLAVAVMPLFERAGYWDPWPSFALYAARGEQVRLYVPADAPEPLPEPAGRFLRSADESDLPGWRPLDLQAWSRAARGAPLYPGARANLGLALGLRRRWGPRVPVRVVLLGPAHWRTAERRRDEFPDIPALARALDAGRLLNGRPAPEPESER